MTAISPLQSIHKKGIFGDHHQKNESDLLNIAELKNLSIIQIVKYKNSKIQLNEIQVDGLKLGLQSSKVSSNNNTRVIWNAPNTLLILSKKENIIKSINENCDNENFAVTDISHSRAIIQIKGAQAKEVLKKGWPINFTELKKNYCAGSVFHGITMLVDCVDDEIQIYNLFALRSFGESLHHHITDASLEFGYLGI